MSSASPQVGSTTPAPAAVLAASQPSTAPVAADKPKASQRAVDATAATAVTPPAKRIKAAKPAKSTPAIATEAAPPAAVTKSRRAKPAPVLAPAAPAPAAAKPAKPAASVKADVKADVKAKPLRVKEKLVRDSFTMPSADFALIHQLKERALGFKRATKKSELLRAGLQALAALSDTQLQALLGKLTAIKAGRPKKAD